MQDKTDGEDVLEQVALAAEGQPFEGEVVAAGDVENQFAGGALHADRVRAAGVRPVEGVGHAEDRRQFAYQDA